MPSISTHKAIFVDGGRGEGGLLEEGVLSKNFNFQTAGLFERRVSVERLRYLNA